jgi:4-hydroxy-tetrahydrodipicolinate synthase
VRLQIQGGVNGVVPVGTTGESPTLSFDEHVRVIERTVKFVAGRVAVLAGAGANSTEEAIYLTREAAKVGADGSLQVAPYYNKPTQEGLYQHFKAIARSSRLPIVLYSIPGRCGVEIGVETIRRLARDCRTVVGIKEAGGNPDRVSQVRATCGPDFRILSGDDSLTLPFMAVGADGVISVASNVIPRKVAAMVRAFREGRLREAQRIHGRLFLLFRGLFVETNPIPVKAALAMLGLIAEEYRLPLTPMSPMNRDALRRILRDCGIRAGSLAKR